MEQFKNQPLDVYKKPMKTLLFGPQSSGKTWNGIDIALGTIMELRGYTNIDDCWKHLAVVDTENRRAVLVLRKKGAVGKGVKYHEVKPPFTTQKIIDLQRQFDAMDEVDVVLYDSLTHYWAKKGGTLDRKADYDSKHGGNSYTNWQVFSGEFNEAIDELLQSPKHIVATSRSKNDTIMEQNAKGKMAPVTYGLKPMLRDDINYDFDIVFNVDKETHALITDKEVPDLKPIYDNVTPDVGKEIFMLFDAGSVVAPRTAAEVMDSIRRMAKDHDMVQFMMLKLSGKKLDDLPQEQTELLEQELIKEIKAQQTKVTSKKK